MMKKLVFLAVLIFVPAAVFAGSFSLGEFAIGPSAGCDIPLLGDITAYRWGFSMLGGLKFLFFQNDVSFDSLEPETFHLTDRLSINLCLPLKWFHVYAGAGVPITFSDYIGYDDIDLRYIKTVREIGNDWNLTLQFFLHAGVGVDIAKHCRINASYSVNLLEFDNDYTSPADIPELMQRGSLNLAVMYCL